MRISDWSSDVCSSDLEKIADAARDKRIEGVADIRDESNREGVRAVIELKRDATAEVVLNQLWRHTPAQSSFPANMLAIRGGRPEMRSEEHTSELQSIMRISYAVFCLYKKTQAHALRNKTVTQ